MAASTGDRLQMLHMPAELAQAVLTLLEGRGLAPDDATRTAIEAVEDPVKMKEMLVLAATVESATELISDE